MERVEEEGLGDGFLEVRGQAAERPTKSKVLPPREEDEWIKGRARVSVPTQSFPMGSACSAGLEALTARPLSVAFG